MKKTFFVLLVLTFIFISCDNDDMSEEVNPFIGTWELIDRSDVRLVFSKTIAARYSDLDSELNWVGVYTYTDTHLTVILDQDSSAIMLETYPNGWIVGYNFNNDILNIYNPALTVFKKVID